METEALTHVRECSVTVYLEFAMLFQEKTKEAASKTLILKGGELSVFSDFIFEEARKNKRIGRENAELYCEEVTDIYRSLCEGINRFFIMDEGYNELINQIETDPIESPEPLSIYLSYSPMDYGIFFNKLFKYVCGALRVYGKRDQAIEASQEPGTTAEQVLLLYYTGIYTHLVEKYNSNYTKVSEVIATIIGGKPSAIKRQFSYLARPEKIDRNNPYCREKIVESVLKKLSFLEIDSSKIHDILTRLKK